MEQCTVHGRPDKHGTVIKAPTQSSTSAMCLRLNTSIPCLTLLGSGYKAHLLVCANCPKVSSYHTDPGTRYKPLQSYFSTAASKDSTLIRRMYFLLHSSLLLAAMSGVLALYNESSKSNLAVYWGQNSVSYAAGNLPRQDRLSSYCKSK